LDTTEKLKTVPKGYDSDHPDIDYLKLKSFTANRSLNPVDLCNLHAAETVQKGFRALHPLMLFLRNALA
jgi:uncharacterized protein (DUF2461 family)